MGRLIFAEENILAYLKNACKFNSFLTGLIIGQCQHSTDYVVHLVRTPDQADKSGEKCVVVESVNDINESWIGDHAKHVSRMLPGGFWVLGAFICSPLDIFNDGSSLSKMKNILFETNKLLTSEPLLYADSPSSEKLLLYVNSNDFRYACKTLDVKTISSSFKPADWKFQNNCTKWFTVSCHFDLDQPSLGGNTSFPLKTQLKHVLTQVNKSIESAMVTLNGKTRNLSDSLNQLAEKQKTLLEKTGDDKDFSSFEASIFTSFLNNPVAEDIKIRKCDVELHLLGVLASRVFLNQKATINDAINAIKQDVIRSFAVRLEMHWDSLVEEEYGSPEEKETLHEPPRRVTVRLPDKNIELSDYLFPGEGASEVVSSFSELLDISISESNVYKDFEIQGDSSEFYGKSSMGVASSSSDDSMRPRIPTGFLLIALSLAVLLIGIAIALHLRRQQQNI